MRDFARLCGVKSCKFNRINTPGKTVTPEVAIHSGQGQVVSYGELGSSLLIDGGDVTIDDLELLGPMPEPGGSAEFFDPQLF